jgi:hypothetical protein
LQCTRSLPFSCLTLSLSLSQRYPTLNIFVSSYLTFSILLSVLFLFFQSQLYINFLVSLLTIFSRSLHVSAIIALCFLFFLFPASVPIPSHIKTRKAVSTTQKTFNHFRCNHDSLVYRECCQRQQVRHLLQGEPYRHFFASSSFPILIVSNDYCLSHRPYHRTWLMSYRTN